MTNKEIAICFKLLADLMELHDENAFKIKAYNNAYLALKKYDKDLNMAFSHEIESIPGLGKAVVEKIIEIVNTDNLGILQDLIKKTPEGIVNMLKIRGLGPKKVKSIWKDLKVEDISELLLACNENRLVEVRGFGQKTQEDIKNKIEFFYSNQGKYLYANIEEEALELLNTLQKKLPNQKHELSGLFRRRMPIVEGIDIISTANLQEIRDFLELDEESSNYNYKNIKVNALCCSDSSFVKELFLSSGSENFLSKFQLKDEDIFTNEEEIFGKNGVPYIPAYLRENEINQNLKNNIDKIIKLEDIKGIIHNHSTYSDGIATLEDMAKACIQRGYKYFVISDHSVSAFYANGLQIERVMQQWREIDGLNKKYPDFKIFKSIESDILNDGSLDYPDDVLKGFDLVIASIHTNLRMDEEKATNRLIKAIENPYTDILGHPTGRLLLGRSGYPIDYKKVIDACAANDVAIELNANPQRLDLDWTWIPYAMEKNVLISINPDAHSISQIDYLKYGVLAASKGGLTDRQCLNSKSLDEFTKWTLR